MNEGKKISGGLIALIILGVLVLGGGILAIVSYATLMGTYQEATRLKNEITAEQKNVKITYDNSWKIVMEKAEVSEQYTDAYKQIIKSMTADRYANGTGTVSASIAENNPTIDLSPLKDLMNTLEGLREKYQLDQKKVLSKNNVYENIRTATVSGMILSAMGFLKQLDIQTVTSTRTENAFETGKDDKVGGFYKEKKDTIIIKDTTTTSKKDVTVPNGVNLIVGNVTPPVPVTPTKK
jgi:hypothetical protein